jgi:micrococcal nuclease
MTRRPSNSGGVTRRRVLASFASAMLFVGCVSPAKPTIRTSPADETRTNAAPTVGEGADAPGSTATVGAPSLRGPLQENARVVFVIDGDTVDVAFVDPARPTKSVKGTPTKEHRERVRLIGIDTPETRKPDTPVECFGKQASQSLEALLPKGTNILIERDIEERDRYGRLLGYIFRADDGLFVNLEMVRAGMALPLTFPPNIAYTDEFLAAGEAARDAQVGLWTACESGHDNTTVPPQN